MIKAHSKDTTAPKRSLQRKKTDYHGSRCSHDRDSDGTTKLCTILAAIGYHTPKLHSKTSTKPKMLSKMHITGYESDDWRHDLKSIVSAQDCEEGDCILHKKHLGDHDLRI